MSKASNPHPVDLFLACLFLPLSRLSVCRGPPVSMATAVYGISRFTSGGSHPVLPILGLLPLHVNFSISLLTLSK